MLEYYFKSFLALVDNVGPLAPMCRGTKRAPRPALDRLNSIINFKRFSCGKTPKHGIGFYDRDLECRFGDIHNAALKIIIAWVPAAWKRTLATIAFKLVYQK